MRWAARFSWLLGVAALQVASVGAWTSPAPVLDTEQDSLDPRTSVDANGKAHVVWRERIDSGLFYIWYTQNTAGVFAPAEMISQGNSLGSHSPVVCVDGTDVHTAWIASPGANYDIWYRKKNVGGWGAIYNASNTSIKSLRPAVAARAGVGPLVAWDEAVYADDNYDTYLAAWTGTGFGSAINISNTAGGSAYGSVNVNLAVSPNGEVTALWSDRISGDYHVNARRRVGGTWQARQELSTLATGPATPGMATGVDSRVHVVYEAEGTIWYQVWNGSSWTSPVGLPWANSIIRPKVAVDGNGVAYVVADAFTDGGNRDILYSTNFNGSFSAWANISSTPGTQSLNGDIGYGAGALSIIWQETSNGQGSTSDYDTWYVVGPQPTSGPTGTLHGLVTDSGGLPLPGASITLGSAYQTASGANGLYTLTGIIPGTYTAVAGKLHYTSQTLNGVNIVANGNTAADFTLSTTPPAPVTGFGILAANTANQLSWIHSASENTLGTMIRVKTTGFPTGPQDGVFVTDRAAIPGGSDFYIHSGLTNGTTYYYAAFAWAGTATRYYATGATVASTPYGPADFNHDGDVDQDDFGAMQACLTGSFVPQLDAACAQAMLDADNDVDIDDVALFIACISGPGVPAGPNCVP